MERDRRFQGEHPLLVRGAPLGRKSQGHLLGLALACGMLAKWAYPFFTTLPVALYLYDSWKRRAEAGGARAFGRGLGWVFFWPFLLAGPWYARALPHILSRVPVHLSGEVARAEENPGVFTYESAACYFQALWEF